MANPTPSREILIHVDRKFSKMDEKVQVQNIGDEIAKLLYGKCMGTGVNGILGVAQTIQTSKTRNRKYSVQLPVFASNYPELHKYIHNMVKHGRSKGVDIAIQLIVGFFFVDAGAQTRKKHAGHSQFAWSRSRRQIAPHSRWKSNH